MDQIPYFGQDEGQRYFLYAWGRNKDGELSIGNVKKSNTPKGVQGIKGLQVLDVGSGQNHSAVVTMDGQLLICGSALHGKLGLEDQNQPSYPKFQIVPAIKNLVAKQVATGDYHTLCLLDNGQVYAWGGTLHKKLGQRAGKPSKIETLKHPITYIGCGDFHSAALAENGELYTWGGGGKDYNKGQLGHGHVNDVEMPTKVLDKVIKFSCGGYHMMALDQDNELWSWGSGLYGETGQGEFVDSKVPTRVKVNFNQKNIIIDDLYIKSKPGIKHDIQKESLIKDISCGGHHSMLLSTKGLVYTCGYAQYGQLGIRTTENQCKFSLVVGLYGKTILQIKSGWNHSLVLSSNSDIYACGHNQAGQLGTGDGDSRTSFVRVTQLEQKRISQIYAGGNHSWALIDYAHPNIDDYSPPSPVQEESKIDQFNVPVEIPQDLEVVLTDVKIYHRFIKIKVGTQYESGLKAKINDYLNTIQKDPNTKLTKFQNDSDATGIKEDILSFTVMLVMDLNMVVNGKEDRQDVKTTQLGVSFIIKRSSFKKNPFYDWINLAEKLITVPGIQIKYFELRPQ